MGIRKYTKAMKCPAGDIETLKCTSKKTAGTDSVCASSLSQCYSISEGTIEPSCVVVSFIRCRLHTFRRCRLHTLSSANNSSFPNPSSGILEKIANEEGTGLCVGKAHHAKLRIETSPFTEPLCNTRRL